jgi:eukaryotic translation initiation factor 2C
MTNFVPLGVRPTLVVTQYDVFFEPDVKNEEGRQEVIQALGIMELLGGGHASGWCFDGSKILYSSSALALPMGSTTATWQGGEERLTGLAFAGTKRQVTVTLSFAATLQAGERFASTDFGLRADDRKHLAVLDVCFKHAATSVGLKALGTALFDTRSQRAWASIRAIGQNKTFELWKGKRQTIVMTAKGPMMQLDAAARVMLSGLKLDDFVSKLVRKQPEQLQMEDFAKLDRMLREKKFKVKISSTHCRRSFILRGIASEPCSRSMFPCTDADGKETEMSVAAYFADKYPDHPLKRPTQWPCVCVGPANDPHKNRIPLELCSIITGQPAPVTPEIQAEMITATADGPESRFKFIEGVHRDMLQDVAANATPMAFEIDFGKQLIEAEATILRSPVLQYKASGQRNAPLQDVQVMSGKGEWNLRAGSGDLGFYQPGRVDGFAVVKFERADDRLVSTFIDKLMGFARSRGMDIGRQEGTIVDLSSHRHGEAIEKALDTAIRRLGTRVGLVICFIGDKQAMNAKELYPAIKRWSHVIGCIPTQCVQVGKATGPKLGTSPQYHAGVLLKINLKLGGANCICKAPDGLGILRAAPTMVMGFDINHPQPGSNKPSYSALVAALDIECTKFHTVIGSQKSRTEVGERSDEIVGFVDKVRECLRAFHRLNGTHPRRILFYRDGVAHNQFEAVKRVEVGRIFEACRDEGKDYVPELTFIVVQQRTAARFAQQNRSQLLPGTIVTSDVVGNDGCVAVPLPPRPRWR